MTALHRAVALEQIDAVPLVGEHLNLDVARALQVALDQHVVVAERVLRLAFGRRQRRRKIGLALGDLHALPPPPPALALISTGKPMRLASTRAAPPLVAAVIARRQRHVGGFSIRRFDSALSPIASIAAGGRSDERDARIPHWPARTTRSPTGKAVTRMDRLRAGQPGGLEHLVAAQIRLFRRRGTDAIRLVAAATCIASRSGVGEHRHRLNAHAARAVRQRGPRFRRGWR